MGQLFPRGHMPPRPKPPETGTIVEGRKHATTSGSHRHRMKVLDLLPRQNQTLEGSPVHRVRKLDQQKAWTIAEVPPWMKLCVFETLRGKRLALQQESVDGARPALPRRFCLRTYSTQNNRPIAHVCCPRAGRPVRPWRSSQGSIS